MKDIIKLATILAIFITPLWLMARSAGLPV